MPGHGSQIRMMYVCAHAASSAAGVSDGAGVCSAAGVSDGAESSAAAGASVSSGVSAGCCGCWAGVSPDDGVSPVVGKSVSP